MGILLAYLVFAPTPLFPNHPVCLPRTHAIRTVGPRGFFLGVWNLFAFLLACVASSRHNPTPALACMMVYEPYKDPAFHGFVPLDTAHNLHPHSHIHKPRQPLSHSVPHLRLHRSLSLDDITASITAMTRAGPIFEDLWRPSPVHSPTATSPLQSPGIKTPHPLEESLLPLSPDELRRRLALPETLNFDKRDKRTSTGHIFSAPLPVHTEPTSPAAGYFTYPANNSPEEHQHHFERVKSLDNDKLDKVTTRPKKPKRAQTAAMAAPGGVNGTERAKVSRLASCPDISNRRAG